MIAVLRNNPDAAVAIFIVGIAAVPFPPLLVLPYQCRRLVEEMGQVIANIVMMDFGMLVERNPWSESPCHKATITAFSEWGYFLALG